MSGFDRKSKSFFLTATKVAYWHRSRGARRECDQRCRTAAGMVVAHLDEFRVMAVGPNAWRVWGPGIEQGWTDELYEAVSGNPPQSRRSPSRRWRF